MKKIVLLLCSFFTICLCQTYAQDVQVTGKVTGANNQPLSGASVVVKGSNTGTVTDANGNYSLKIPAGSTLQISYSGTFEQEAVIEKAGARNFKLAPVTGTIEEVVVIGYGQKKKGLIASAVSTVNEQQIANTSNTRIEQVLQGRVAGVYVAPTSGQPGSSLSLRIRGTSSNRNTDPLYIVDGIVSGGIESLDPAEIASVSVLKDAGASAIYGAAGGNGVVLISTKKGHKGTADISFSAQFGNQSVKDDYVKMMNAQQYQQYLAEAGVNGAPTFTDVANIGTGTKWLNSVTETAPQYRYSLAVSGGSDRSIYFLEGNIFKQDGIVGGNKSQFNRTTVRINSEHKVKSWLTMGESLSLSHHTRKAISDNDEFGSILSTALVMDPITPVVYNSKDVSQLPAHVQAAITANQPLRMDPNGYYYGLSNFLKGEYGNPVARIDIFHGQNVQNKIFGNVYAEIAPFKDFKFTSRFGIDAAFQTGHNWVPTYWFSSESLNTVATGSDYSDTWNTWQWENFASYTKRFDQHNITVLAGASQLFSHEVHVGGSYSGLFKEQDKFSYADFVPDAVDRIGSNTFDESLASFYGRLSYDYAGRYILEASFRTDGCSRFAPDHQWGQFPAISAAWIFSKESFATDATNVMNYGKLRISWGQNGNYKSVGNGEWQNSISANGSYANALGTFLVGAYPTSIPNPELSWETIEQFNIGTDLAFLKNRINVSIDYYNKLTKDLLTDGKAPYFVGNSLKTVNAGNVRNKGWEFDLSYKNLTRSPRDFTYEIGGNLAFNDNEVTSLAPNTPFIPGANIGTGWNATAIKIGQPLWYFNGYHTTGIFQNQAQIDAYINKTGITGYNPKPGDVIVEDVNGDKLITPKDYVMIGSPHPKMLYGARLQIGYRGFDLFVFVQGQSGNDILMGFNRTDRATANKPEFFFNNRWTGENSTNEWFRATSSDQYAYSSDKMIFDGAFTRIRQIQLGYSLPQSTLDKVKFKIARVYFSLDDYFTFTKYPGVDPETSRGGNSLGIDRGGYPIPRKMTFGLSFTF